MSESTRTHRPKKRLQHKRTNSGDRTASSAPPERSTSLGRFYSAGPVVPSPLALQTKLVVGTADDAYEREADAVAAHVAAGRSAPPISPLPPGGPRTPQRQPTDEEKDATEEELQTWAVQRQLADDEEEPEEPIQSLSIQRQPMEEAEETEPEEPMQMKPVQRQATEEEGEGEETENEEEPLQPRSSLNRVKQGQRPVVPSTANEAVRQPGPGEPLPTSTRRTLESHLRTDLRHVRVHRDASAHEAADDLNARAFTHRNHIWLGEGESPGDVALMAHEATHVVQQSGADRQAAVQRAERAAPDARSPAASPAMTTSPDARPTESTDRASQVQETEQSFTRQMEGQLQLEPGYVTNADRSERGLPPPGDAETRADDALTQISAAKEELQAEAERTAEEEPETPAEAPEPAEEPQDAIPADEEPDAVAAEVESLRAPVQEASLPVDEIRGSGPESQSAVDRLRGMQTIDPRLVGLAEAVNERIAGLRDRVAENAERSAAQLRGEAEAQREAIRGSMAASQAAVDGIMAATASQVAQSKTTAQEDLMQQGEDAHAQNAEITAAETSRLQENLDGSVEEGRTIFREADEEVHSTGTEEAQRGRDYHYDLARRAREMGRREAAYYRRTEEDEDLGEDKAEAVMDVAERFARQLIQDGDGLHADVLEQTEEAREQVTAEEEPTVQGLADVAPGAVESIQTFLGSVDDGIDQVTQQGTEQLNAAETGAQTEIDALDQAARGRGEALLGQGEAQLDAALVSGLLSQANLAGQAGQMLDGTGRDAIEQLEQVATGGTSESPGEPALVQRQPTGEAEAVASEDVEEPNEALETMDQMGPALDQAADSQTAELAQSLDETAAISDQVGGAWVDETQGRMDSLTDVADTGMTDIAGAAGDQLDSTLEQGETQAASEVDRISQDVANNVDQVRTSVDGGVSEATDKLRGGVDDGITHADEVIGELPSKMDEAAEAQESFFGSIGHWFSEQLAQTWQAIKGMADWGFLLDLAVGIVVGVLVTVAVVALLGTGVGAILVAGALAGAAGFAAAQMSANVRNGDPLFHNVGHAAILGGFVGLAGAIGTVTGLGLLAGTGLVMLGAGIGTVVANVATGREWDDHLLANILIIGVFHAVFKSAVDRLPPSWRLPVRRGPAAEEPPGEVPARPEPRPAENPPAGMSARLSAIRSGLTDPRAIEAFDAKFESLRGDSARMEAIIDAMSRSGDLEARLIAEWERGNPAPRGEAIEEVPGLRNRAEALRSEIEQYVDRNPSARKLLSDVNDSIGVLDEMLSGRRTATADAVQGERNNLNGIEAELRSARGEPGQPAVGRKFPLDGRPDAVEVDVVSQDGLRWIETKNTEPFGLESTNWTGDVGKQGARTQAQEMVRAAQQNPVNGQTPQVIWNFPKGVSLEVAAALRAMGITVRGQLANVPPPVTPPPPSTPREREEHEEGVPTP